MCVKFKDALKTVFKRLRPKSRKGNKKVYIGDKVYIKKNFYGDIYLEPFPEVNDEEFND